MPDQPNVLILFTDQQRADTVRALGNPHMQTPTMDALAAEGTSFTSAYCATPVCIASRCSMILSQWAHQTDCTTNCAMPQERTSFMEIFQDAGWQTHGTGKMHFAPDSHKLWGYDARDYSEEGAWREHDDYCRFVHEHGYDHVFEVMGPRSEYYYIPQVSQLPARLHNTTWVADRSLDFLKQRDTDRPFMLWSSFIKPHPPFESPTPWHRLYKPTDVPLPHLPADYEALQTYWNRRQNRYKYRDQGWDDNFIRTMRAAYAACVSFVDYHAGRILDYLRETGELDNTIVIWTSDHGELLGDFGSFGKRSIFDAAANVPLIVRYPERFTPGEVCDTVCSHVDVAPTILQGCGLDTIDQHEGHDLAETASGNRGDRPGVLVQYSQEESGLYGLIDDDFKYVFSAADDQEWLFRRWPGEPEERSLAGNQAYLKTTQEMREKLTDWFRADGYTDVLSEDGWRVYPPEERPSVDANPDHGLLYQEGADWAPMFPEGYAPISTPQGPIRIAPRKKDDR
ncbi:MAG: sulfatase-like hydrolase/transferase [Armatimonadia bacterium]|nr:sulfatase-like hydrolase/transferase [Armatimonadia bacterium]